jgi:tRNA (mo5U34)-methyltransferase
LNATLRETGEATQAGTETSGALREQIDALGPWFHNLRLRGEQTSPGHFLGDYPSVKFASFRDALPADLTGKTVLDIGCNAGFYSFEMKRRGAARVLGIEVEDLYLRQARFAAEIEGLDVEFRKMSVWDLGAIGERFDLVIFMGVLYHLRHPLLALDLIHDHVAKDMLLFQSMQRGSRNLPVVKDDYAFSETAHFHEPGYPAMYFVEQRYCGDDTNWWIPNRACAEAMLRSSGFRIEAQPEDEVYLCRRVELPELHEGPRPVYPSAGQAR